MADITSIIGDFVVFLTRNPAYLILGLGGAAFLILLILVWHIRKIRRQEIFIHQAWGANWKGR